MKVQRGAIIVLGVSTLALLFLISPSARARFVRTNRPQLSAPFTNQVLSTSAEAPLALRMFTTAVKTDSQGKIITGLTSDPVKNIIGPEAAGERGGMQR